jgi:dolichyl-phosphate beta-glucosyltransferase
MRPAHDICIVIPCYNEGTHFRRDEYLQYLSSSEGSLLCFVNDGSVDSTSEVLVNLQREFPERVEIVSYAQNRGKAHAVREGMLFCNAQIEFKNIAYLDADLAVSLEECHSLTGQLTASVVFCFGSRIARIGSEIKRKRRRFLIGRFIATIISNILFLKVYDTQCGCKVFEKELSAKIFARPFLSTWLFDVEIFCRMIELYGRETAPGKMLEYPLKRWTDRGNSKVSALYFFRIWTDLYRIRATYRETLSRKR